MYDQEAIRINIIKHLYAIAFFTAFCTVVYVGSRLGEEYARITQAAYSHVAALDAFNRSAALTMDSETVAQELLQGARRASAEIEETLDLLFERFSEVRSAELIPLDESRRCLVLFATISSAWAKKASYNHEVMDAHVILPSVRCLDLDIPLLIASFKRSGISPAVLTESREIGERFRCPSFLFCEARERWAEIFDDSLNALRRALNAGAVSQGGPDLLLLHHFYLQSLLGLPPQDQRGNVDITYIRQATEALASQQASPDTFGLAGLTLSKTAVFCISILIIMYLVLQLDFELSKLSPYFPGSARQPFVITDWEGPIHFAMALALSLVPLGCLLTVGLFAIDAFESGMHILGWGIYINPLRGDFQIVPADFLIGLGPDARSLPLTLLLFASLLALYITARTTGRLILRAVRRGH